MSSDGWIAFAICSAILALTLLGMGADEASHHGKCEYTAIVDYFPARAVGCELWKKRW